LLIGRAQKKVQIGIAAALRGQSGSLGLHNRPTTSIFSTSRPDGAPAGPPFGRPMFCCPAGWPTGWPTCQAQFARNGRSWKLFDAEQEANLQLFSSFFDHKAPGERLKHGSSFGAANGKREQDEEKKLEALWSDKMLPQSGLGPLTLKQETQIGHLVCRLLDELWFEQQNPLERQLEGRINMLFLRLSGHTERPLDAHHRFN